MSEDGGDARGAGILVGLQRPGKHVYAGTVPYAEVERRRKRNRTAKKSRRANR